MAFDLSTAQPVGAGGFDLSTAKPVGEQSAFDKYVKPLTLDGDLRGSVYGRVMQGMADPVVGLVQLGANAAGSIFGDGISSSVNKAITDKEKQYEASRASQASTGFDPLRLAGNVLSPVNLAAASAIPAVGTTMGRVGLGASLGAAGGASEPVLDTSEGYWGNKAKQIGAASAVGAVATPIFGKVADAIVRKLPMSAADVQVTGVKASMMADNVVADAVQQTGQSINDIPKPQLDALRKQVIDSLKAGKQIDAAALMRQQDFKSLGISPLQGQITRDPLQFAREQNLKGVAGVGDEIALRLNSQDGNLRKFISGFSNGADEAYPAGVQLSQDLAAVDSSMRKRVFSLYEQARQSAGKDLDVPLTGLAQDYADVLHRFGNKVPDGVVNQFKALGLDPATPSNQKKIFTIEDADKLLKTINDNVGNDITSNRSLDVLRNAVKSAVTSVDATGGPFAPAVQAAASRFRVHEAVPALEAAANGSAVPDSFVNKFVINGRVDEVTKMAKLLSPESFNQARAQLGQKLHRAAFGMDSVGDKGFSQERFNKAVSDIGTDKLKVFFTPAEVDQIKTIGRVAAYIHSLPSASPVNTSGTAAALFSLLQHIPGLPAGFSVANSLKNTVQRGAQVRSSLAAQVPVSAADLAPNQPNRLAALIAAGAFGSGSAAASAQR